MVKKKLYSVISLPKIFPADPVHPVILSNAESFLIQMPHNEAKKEDLEKKIPPQRQEGDPE